MIKINPIKEKKLPLSIHQAICKKEKRGNSIFLWIKQKLLSNSFKNHECYQFNHLILGSNPILSLLLLIKINNSYPQKLNTKVNIGILLSKNNDYWGYHCFENDDFLNELNTLLKSNYKHINDFFDIELKKLNFNENINIILIDNYFNIQTIEKDNYTNQYIIHLKKFEEENISLFESMKYTLSSTNNIKNKFLSIFKNKFLTYEFPNFKLLRFSDNLLFSEDTQFNSHILISDNIYLTSLFNSLNSSYFNDEINFNNEKYDITSFQHPFINNSYGSSKNISNVFINLDKIVLNDISKL